MRNATLVQSLVPADTSAEISGDCPPITDAGALVDCGDPPLSANQLLRLRDSLAVRTLLIRSDDARQRISVNLDHVKIDRGRHADSGSRTDSAGIWLEGADRVDFDNVEITGDGKGYGLLLIRARNVTLTNLWVHDLVWSPYRGERPLAQARVASAGWNSVPIREFRAPGEQGARLSKFYGVRVQEQITCAYLAQVEHVRIENARIERCMARFDTGDLPWQADGLDIGESSADVRVDGASINSTWEAMDVVATGTGIDGLVITNLSVSNAFADGLKIGYRVRDLRASGLRILDVGLAGIVVHGPVAGAVIRDARIEEVGIVQEPGGAFSPWPALSRAGIRVDFGSSATAAAGAAPRDLLFQDALISNSRHPGAYSFGIRNETNNPVRTVNFRAQGFNVASITGPVTRQ